MESSPARAELRAYLEPFSALMQYHAVLQTRHRPFLLTKESHLQSAAVQSSRDLRLCGNMIDDFYFGSRARRRPDHFGAIMFSVLEGLNSIADRKQTLHYHVLFGNIPLSEHGRSFQDVLYEKWVGRCGGRGVHVVPLLSESQAMQAIWYVTKELTGLDGAPWDVINTRIPSRFLDARSRR